MLNAGAKNRRKARSQKQRVNGLPPKITVQAEVRHVYRFQANASLSSASITVSNVLASCGGVCTVMNSIVQGWASSVRINKVTIWPAYDGSSGGQAFVSWISPQTKDSSENKTIPTGITVTGPIVSIPPRNTFAAGWWNNNQASTQLMALSMPTGSVVDVDLSYTLSNEFGSVTFSAATASLGSIYYAYFDGQSTHKLTPQGLMSTT